MSRLVAPSDEAPPLRYVIIGAGAAVAERHLGALAEIPAQVVGMCDIDEPRGRERARRAGCAFDADAAALIRAVRPDVAVICTPHPSHARLALACLATGVHVLVEKPIAVDVSEGDAVVAGSEASGAVLAVCFGERFRPAVERARRITAAGELGRVLRVSAVASWRRDPAYYRESAWRGTWRGEGGGVLLNQAPHLLDVLGHLLGPPRTVWGVTRTVQQPIECEDTAHALLEYPGGAIGYVAVSTAQGRAERRLELVGERANLLLEGDRLSVTGGDGGHERDVLAGVGASDELGPAEPTIVASGHLAVHRDLRRAILEGSAPRCGARDALMSLELANAITLSSARDRPVTLPLDRHAYAELLRERRGS